MEKSEDITPCDRCGKCCVQFKHQIHYRSDELLNSALINSSNLCMQLYLRIKNLFQKEEAHQLRFYVPLKSDLLALIADTSSSEGLLSEEDLHILKISDTNQDECMFLNWDAESLPFCEIQAIKPHMCKAYPDSKGGVCLNHKERYYTPRFLEFQCAQNLAPMQVVYTLYKDQISDPIAYDILSYLMDFGKFSEAKTMALFTNYFEISPQQFQRSLKELIGLGLVQIVIENDERCIESISTKEIEQKIDQYIHDHNWVVPTFQ